MIDLGKNIKDPVDNSVWGSVRNSVCHSVWDSVRSSVNSVWGSLK